MRHFALFAAAAWRLTKLRHKNAPVNTRGFMLNGLLPASAALIGADMKITFDRYSGRRNTSWTVPFPAIPKILEILGANRKLAKQSAAYAPARLGYRGFQVSDMPLTMALANGLSPSLYFPADSLLRHILMLRDIIEAIRRAAEQILDELLNLIQRIIRELQRLISPGGTTPPPVTRCPFDPLPFDASFWNDSAHILRNNCYAYASNQRTDTFPQPGRASGTILDATNMNCADVKAASILDGMHEVNDCFPDTEKPRHLVALVIWPGEDYHWYRKHPSFWGHKPGETPARNTDDSAAVITNPATCDRGGYTDFCGFFLLPKSQRVA